MTETKLDIARRMLKSVFGFSEFRRGQEEIVEAVLSGEPTLAIMPTGSGKSLCYQLPSLCETGLTVVISPLIALMRDQVLQMQALGIAAGTLNSQTTPQENKEIWAAIRSGKLRMLYVSPERLASESIIAELRKNNVCRVAVDEAHCVCEWGHDFRKEYLLINEIVLQLGSPQVVAFTATADKAMQDEIAARLFNRKHRFFIHSFDRPNITLSFLAKEEPRKQIDRFIDVRRDRAGIVYCATRGATEIMAEHLRGRGHRAFPYHAGMDQAVRNANQDRFLREDGVIICATNAFGLGVNKPDVRWVIHSDLPSSVEAYYQEIGRAGRDGLPADTLTLYGLEDMALRRRQIDEKEVSEERRRHDHRRFDALVSLCEAATCRRQTLLAHFDEAAPPCGACDICQGKVLLRDGSVDAQKALSAVYRTGQRFGAAYLCDLLVGSESDALKRNGHNRIKTFGVGADRSKRDWASTIRQLFAAGALKTASAEFGGFALTDKGVEILYGREAFRMRVDPPREAVVATRRALKPRQEPTDAAAVALEKLRALRRELAGQYGIAAYMVFPDRTLLEMAERKPVTLGQMRSINGVGERKLELYGGKFLAVISQLAA